ncbi:FecR family protein [Larkinella ripae]
MKPLDYYATLEAIDLARDPDFRAWVRHPSPARNQFWDSVKALYPEQQATLEQARLLVIGLEAGWQEVSESVVQQSFERLRQKQLDRQPERRRRFFRPVFYRYAAAVSLLLVGGWWLSNRTPAEVEYKTAYGQMQTITLPDGSVVTLNANSTLSRTADWQTAGRREVRLTGEAFFDVNKKPAGQPMPFVVHTGAADVVVLGTRFNVNTRHARMQVVLQEGKVKVQLRQQPDVVMQPGDWVEATQNRATVRRARVNTRHYIAWRDNLLVLNDEPLGEIVQRLKDQYGLTIAIADKSLLREQFTGTVPASQPDLLLRLIAESFRLQISKQENQIVLSKLNP